MNNLSFVIPVFNVERYLRRCLDSVLVNNEDFNVFVIDDCSTDSSGEILDSYKDPRLTVVHLEKNIGLADVKNYALDNLPLRDWVGIVDSDDWINSGLYLKVFSQGVSSGPEVDMISLGANIVYDRRLSRPVKIGDVTSDYIVEDPFEVFETDRNSSWSLITKRSLFGTDIRFPSGRVYEDVATNYKLVERARKIFVSKEAPYYYLFRDSSISHKSTLKNETDRLLSHTEFYEAVKGKVSKKVLKRILSDIRCTSEYIVSSFKKKPETELAYYWKQNLYNINEFLKNSFTE